MLIEMKFHSVADVAALQRLAVSVEEQVLLTSGDGSMKVDAKSFIGLFTLDFSQPITVITDSSYVMRRLEASCRARAATVSV